MGSDELNDQIRHLCAQAIMARDSEIEPILGELRERIHQHSEMVRAMAIHALIQVSSEDTPPGSSAKAAD